MHWSERTPGTYLAAVAHEAAAPFLARGGAATLLGIAGGSARLRRPHRPAPALPAGTPAPRPSTPPLPAPPASGPGRATAAAGHEPDDALSPQPATPRPTWLPHSAPDPTSRPGDPHPAGARAGQIRDADPVAAGLGMPGPRPVPRSSPWPELNWSTADSAPGPAAPPAPPAPKRTTAAATPPGHRPSQPTLALPSQQPPPPVPGREAPPTAQAATAHDPNPAPAAAWSATRAIAAADRLGPGLWAWLAGAPTGARAEDTDPGPVRRPGRPRIPVAERKPDAGPGAATPTDSPRGRPPAKAVPRRPGGSPLAAVRAATRTSRTPQEIAWSPAPPSGSRAESDRSRPATPPPSSPPAWPAPGTAQRRQSVRAGNGPVVSTLLMRMSSSRIGLRGLR